MNHIPVTVEHEKELRLSPIETHPASSSAQADAVGKKKKRSGSIFVRAWRLFSNTIHWLFGAVTMVLLLAMLAAIPILQFLTLGYVVEAGGRVARTGRLRSGLFGIRQAATLGGILLGTWLVLWPLQIVVSMRNSALLIDPQSSSSQTLAWVVPLLALFTTLHIIGACGRGGRLRHFLFPIINPLRMLRGLLRPGKYKRARDAVWDFTVSLRLRYYFWLGARLFLGSFLWLALPVTLLALGREIAPLGFLGALLLFLVVLYLPFLQANFAANGRFSNLFAVRKVRLMFRRAPVAFCLAMFLTVLLSLPLYLLKIELVPQEAVWLPSLLFVMFIFPSRVITGWAYSRARRREINRHWFFRWISWLGIMPLAAIYVLVLFFSQYTAWHGIWSLYEQHAFLVPVPFIGL